VATNKDVDVMTQTIGEMSEAQSNSYEALADNFAAFQRRNMDFAQGGLEFLRLQESNARAVQEWWTNGLKLLQLQQHNISFAQNWLSSGIGALQDQTEQNRSTAEVFVQSVRKQQEGFRNLSEKFAGTYQNFFFSPFDYAQAFLRTAQQATQQGLQLAVEASEQTEQVIQEAEQVVQEAEQAIEEAELEVAVLSALGSEDYEELAVADISKKLDDFTTEDLKKLRVYEKQNKNRETLIDQLDRKIKAATS
jgi:chaperonin cofactor prefoldin